jgi:hypothetical protein
MEESHVNGTEIILENGTNGSAHENGNGTEHQTTFEVKKIEIPTAKLSAVVVTDYMTESLKKVAVSEGFKNFDFKIDHGSAIGDGFVGIMFKAIVNEKDSDKTLTVVLKSPPTNLARRNDFGSMQLFRREVLVYNEVLPEFVKFQEEKKISRANGFFDFPKCYFAEYNEEKDDAIIIMEDLRESGHRMWDKFVPTNYEHTKLLMSALGRFHAVSFAMKTQRPQLYEKYKEFNDFFADQMGDVKFTDMMVNSIDRAVGTLDESDVKGRNKVLKMKESLETLLKSLTDPKAAEPYSIVTHGDCWSNNFMYHYKVSSGTYLTPYFRTPDNLATSQKGHELRSFLHTV